MDTFSLQLIHIFRNVQAQTETMELKDKSKLKQKIRKNIQIKCSKNMIQYQENGESRILVYQLPPQVYCTV